MDESMNMKKDLKSIVILTGELHRVASRYELERRMAEAAADGEDRTLRNVDISGIDIDNMVFKGFRMENVVIGSFDPSTPERKRIHHVDFSQCSMRNVVMAQCEFSQCVFDDIVCDSPSESDPGCIDFFFSVFSYCRFRRAKLTLADFRYSRIADCSLGECHFWLCDFYMTAFEGVTNFHKSCFESCSLTYATFENEVLRMENILSLNQEDVVEYGILNNPSLHKYNPTGGIAFINHSHERIIMARRENRVPDPMDRLESELFLAKEATDIYINLSGIYSGKGLNRDSNLSYRKANIQKKKYYRLLMRDDFKRGRYGAAVRAFLKWQSQVFVGALGYGYRMMPAFLWLGVVIVVFAVYYFIASKNQTALGDGLAYSIANSLSPYDKYLQDTKVLLASIETVLGVVIMGFIGFIFANKIRNNS